MMGSYGDLSRRSALRCQAMTSDFDTIKRGCEAEVERERMSEPKFTPGPWNCRDEHPAQACVYVRPDADKWDEIATCYARADFANARADAALIAAAPDMYIAARAVRGYCIPGMNWTDEIGRRLLADLDAALAKARGE